MSGECRGWSTWDRFKEAGVVDEHIDFSDNKVVVDNVLGRTRDTIGKCFAIDAAVAYTLSKAGPDANLTVQDMVNEYTRTAAAMMNGRVGYGYVYKTGHLDGEHYTSCGHDEIEAEIVHLMAPTYMGPESGKRGQPYIYIEKAGWRATTMEDFLETNRAPEDIQALASFRVERDAVLGYRLIDVMMSERMRPLKEWIEGHFDCKTWKMYDSVDMDADGEGSVSWQLLSPRIRTSSTRGVCGWSLDGSDRYCTYHDADEQTERGWWMVSKKGKTNEFVKVWNGARCSSGWNSNMFDSNGEWYHNRQIIRWSEVRRAIANSIDEDEVKRQIKKALNRMTKRNKNIVLLTDGEMGDGAPEYRTFRWSDWSWLAVIQAAVAQTSKKNRKEGDVVNGWKYTKISSKRSYGHEIAEFQWQADGDISTYIVKVYPKDGGYYTSQNPLPYRFKTAEEAVKFTKMLSMIATKAGGIALDREWDKVAGKDAPIGTDRLKVQPVKHGEHMKMEMSKEPEDLPSPTDILQKVFWGLPNEYETAVENLEGKPFKKYKVKVTETEVTA